LAVQALYLSDESQRAVQKAGVRQFEVRVVSGTDVDFGLGGKAFEVRESCDDGLLIDDIVGAGNHQRAGFPLCPSRLGKVNGATETIDERTILQVGLQLIESDQARTYPVGVIIVEP